MGVGTGKPAVYRSHFPAIGARPAVSRPGNRQPRVLYIDSDVDKRSALEGGLKGHIGVMGVATIEEARRLARIIRFDAVVIGSCSGEAAEAGQLLHALSIRARTPAPLIISIARGTGTAAVALMITRAVGATAD